MKAFINSEKTVAFIPEVVQEVADFKNYISDFHHEGGNAIEGHDEMHLFKFYVVEDMEDAGWPVMRYKKRSSDPSWLPPGKRGCKYARPMYFFSHGHVHQGCGVFVSKITTQSKCLCSFKWVRIITMLV